MRYDYPVCRFIAVYEDHWEIREGTELDMNEIVDEFCDDGLVSEKGTPVSRCCIRTGSSTEMIR